MRLLEFSGRLSARRLRRGLGSVALPKHVGLIIDGNRRWARKVGLENPSLGHRHGAEHVGDALTWCEDVGIRHVTVFVCSTENLLRRGQEEIANLMRAIEEVISANLSEPDRGWQVHVAGRLDLLPTSTARALEQAQHATRESTTGRHVTLAVGYGGRQEIVDAARSLLASRADSTTSLPELAETLTVDDLAPHLYTKGQPDVDLVIRTSGERRLSNWLLWQTTHAELYFSDKYWPEFGEVDFLRALHAFASRRPSPATTAGSDSTA
jgi:short-chain Z-isoprenyl diphosphate synthase